MTNQSRKSHNVRPTHKKQQSKPNATNGNKAASKKSPTKGNYPLAILHYVFKFKKDSRKNKTFYVLVALCKDTQRPWEHQNLGYRINSGSFREHMKNMVISD